MELKSKKARKQSSECGWIHQYLLNPYSNFHLEFRSLSDEKIAPYYLYTEQL